jgi:hypothetical protein
MSMQSLSITHHIHTTTTHDSRLSDHCKNLIYSSGASNYCSGLIKHELDNNLCQYHNH